MHLLPFSISRGQGYTAVDDESTVVHLPNSNSSNIQSLDESNKKRRNLAVLGIIFSALIFVFTFNGNKMNKENPSLGSIMDRSQTFKQVSHPEPPSSYWGVVTKPYPTGAFWTNLVVKTGDGVIGLPPYGVKTLDTGVQVSYGAARRVVTQLFVADPFMVDIQLSAVQGYVSRSVEAYDNSSVTMTYKTSNGGKYKTHLVKGAPFITVVYDNTTPVISAELMNIYDVEQKLFKASGDGVYYIITLGSWQKWMVYCSENVVFQWKDNALTAVSPIRGFVRVAVLPLAAPLDTFKGLVPFVKKYPTGALWTFAYPTPGVVEANIQFTTMGTGPLLMHALPHQLQIMQVPNPKSDDIAAAQKLITPPFSIKGKLKVVLGEQWKLVYNLVQVGWNFVPAEKLSNYQMDSLAKFLIADVNEVAPQFTDPYGFGKQVGRLARLALIADEFGIPAVRQQAISNLETSLLPWLTGTNLNALLYDKTWGGIVPTKGLESNTNEFGSGWYSDHHFHYGYFVYALATLAKLDAPFWTANRPAIEAIVRDICNPDPSDPDFPFFRHKDLFDGHSWASGLFQQGNGKGQESSSESINAYYGGYLYGLATGNAELTRLSHTMLTMEIQSTKVYWHMTDASVPDIYDPIFAANRMLGNIGAIDITSSTWFGSKYEFVHGINMMPLTPITAILFDQPYVMKEWPVVGTRLLIEQKVVPDKIRQCSASKGWFPHSFLRFVIHASLLECVALGLLGNCCPNNENVFLQCCSANNTADALGVDVISDEYKSYIYFIQAVVDRDSAWRSLLALPTFGAGGSRTNSLYWAASRSPAPLDYSPAAKAPEYASLVSPSCSANSPCQALGLVYGDCCPMSTGTSLSCCDRFEVPKSW